MRLPVYRADLNPSRNECRTWKRCQSSGPRCSWPPQPQGRVAETALRRPRKPTPVCNAPDMPTSVRSFMARKYVEPPQSRNANDERRLSLDASRSCGQRSPAPPPQTSIAKLPDGTTMHPQDDLVSFGQRDTALTGVSFERLEPCEGKLSRTVLRGVWAG